MPGKQSVQGPDKVAVGSNTDCAHKRGLSSDQNLQDHDKHNVSREEDAAL